MEKSLIKMDTAADILPQYRGTPVADLLDYHNLGVQHRCYTDAELLIGMCMDHRLRLRIPSNFAYILRCAGANLAMLEFDVSFAIAVGGVRSVCLIGHDGCRMVDVASKREAFVSGLVDNVGWDRHRAEEHFEEHSSRYGIGDVASFVWLEAQRLRKAYAGISVAPLVFSLDDRRLYQITDSHPSIATAYRTVEKKGGEERP
ncbi:MAG: carbonic anhydrase [Planctomycetes bacterium]|nr:carbonic anhydrase [Planctomycetota bacterium]